MNLTKPLRREHSLLKGQLNFVRILCGQNLTVRYPDISIPAKPLALPCSNVAGFPFPEAGG